MEGAIYMMVGNATNPFALDERVRKKTMFIIMR